jgi:hypothetical protein
VEEEWNGMTAVLDDQAVDELLLVTTAREDDVKTMCAGGWRRWLSSWIPWWLNDMLSGVLIKLARRRRVDDG